MLSGAGTAHAATAVAGRAAATPGEPASSLASAVPTCVSRALSRTDRASAALRAIAGAGVPIASAQVCVLRERPVAIVSFATPAQRAAAQSAVQAVLAYYGAGATWLAVPVGEGAPAGQLSAVQDVAAALGGSLHHGAAGA